MHVACLQVLRLVVFDQLIQAISTLNEASVVFVDGRSGNGERKHLASMREWNIPDFLEGFQDLVSFNVKRYVTTARSDSNSGDAK